jgi:stearoyl-CoA desaturase (delta-9 desaturase)
MCKTSSSDTIDLVKPVVETEEDKIAKKAGWFSVRYYNDRKTRYVFVNVEEYGIVWTNVMFFIGLHALFCYALTMLFVTKMYNAWLYSYIFGWISGVGITAGAHRLWSHKTYNASLPLRMFLSLLFTMAGQNDIYTWARDHRLHHKFTETDADPHNSRRGAFFAHVGWLLTRKHPDIIIKGKTIDNSDLMNDSVVYWNKKLYVLWYLLFRMYIPSLIPCYMFNEELRWCFIGCFAQYIAGLHTTWFVNSAAHIFGDRPYNDKIQPRQNIWVTLTAFGEGYHNYHHTFPWDYRIAEFGFPGYDCGKWFIDFMYFLGLASNLRQASPALIAKTKAKIAGYNVDKEFYLHDHPYHQPHKFCETG